MGKGKARHNPKNTQNNFKHCAYDGGTEIVYLSLVIPL